LAPVRRGTRERLGTVIKTPVPQAWPSGRRAFTGWEGETYEKRGPARGYPSAAFPSVGVEDSLKRKEEKDVERLS